MVCPKCGSDRVTVQLVEADVTVKHHSIAWWLFIGIWWYPIKFTLKVILCIPMFFIKMFIPKKEVYGKKQKSVCVCQNCGYHWDA